MNVPLKYNLRSMWQRKSRTMLTAFGISAVIAVFVAMVAFGRGMSASFARSGSLDNIVVVQKGAFNQSLSSLPKTSRDIVPYFPHIKKKGERILASAELSIEPWVTVPGRSEPIFMVARGVEPVFFDVADKVKILHGSADLKGNRVFLGQGAQQKLGGILPGDSFSMFGESWRVIGVFEAGGTNLEFEILVDQADLMRAANRDEFSCFTLKLDRPEDAQALIPLIENDRRILFGAAREQDFYASTGKIYSIIAQLGLLISIIVSLGAVFGGMNTMYSAVSGRIREIGTLRAIGFSRNRILVSFLTESVVISAIGGLIGIVLGSLVHGFRISVLSANIRFSATWEVLLSGFLLSILVGLIGGWMPARIASRIHAAEAMRRA
jgi:ABC-type antimicrobial peptide transport system permease subunit